MLRSSLFTLFALSIASITYGNPLVSQTPLTNVGRAHTTEGWSYSDCGLASDVVQIESINVSPDPPKPGQALTVTVKAAVTSPIEEGAYADVVVKLGLIKLLQKRFDLCEEAINANATVQCPVEAGVYTIAQTVDLPREIPRAKFSVSVRGFTGEDEDMFCVDLKVDFMKKPFFKVTG
ncbi:ML domain-containing protein [Collybia nuda]|uniref:Phosphatidylglycerol/phosphatidylinositol transfer protein n=1 Tax=Collybia nuda TaxID=64659 RepID=A0A9P5Y176_9AGAR|nr:ML domain-containing protein [Collybia nuda]